MTRPNLSALVVDGESIKLRLQAERLEGDNVTHIDWLRFTTTLRDAPLDLDLLFPTPESEVERFIRQVRGEVQSPEFVRLLSEIKTAQDFAPAAQALSLGRRVVEVLGEGFTIPPEIRKGHDFYGKRWSIELEGKEVGWVGFGVSSDSPRQRKQARTVHVNLYGTACTFARPRWADGMADLIDEVEATITRIDLAADFFDGYTGGIESVKADYENGLCNVGGKRPDCNMVGDWCNGAERSFYIGSKEAGKQTNAYEKGHQLYGRESGCNWLRFELRYGNKLRDLPSSALRQPDSFFAGASNWHASVLHQLRAAVVPVSIPCESRISVESLDAEVHRNLTWIERVAAPSISLALSYLSYDKLLSIIEHKKRPGRLSCYSAKALAGAYERALTRFPVGSVCPSPAMAVH